MIQSLTTGTIHNINVLSKYHFICISPSNLYINTSLRQNGHFICKNEAELNICIGSHQCPFINNFKSGFRGG